MPRGPDLDVCRIGGHGHFEECLSLVYVLLFILQPHTSPHDSLKLVGAGVGLNPLCGGVAEEWLVVVVG